MTLEESKFLNKKKFTKKNGKQTVNVRCLHFLEFNFEFEAVRLCVVPGIMSEDYESGTRECRSSKFKFKF